MIVENFTINGTDYVWYRYTEPLDVLTASDVNNIQSNLATIRSILLSKGYSIEELDSAVSQVDTPLVEIIDKLNAVEYNLDVLDSTDVKSIYYDNSYRAEAGGKAHNTEQIWRWFQVANDIIEIAKGNVGKWGYLECVDGFPTINGKRLLIRGDLIE